MNDTTQCDCEFEAWLEKNRAAVERELLEVHRSFDGLVLLDSYVLERLMKIVWEGARRGRE